MSFMDFPTLCATDPCNQARLEKEGGPKSYPGVMSVTGDTLCRLEKFKSLLTQQGAHFGNILSLCQEGRRWRECCTCHRAGSLQTIQARKRALLPTFFFCSCYFCCLPPEGAAAPGPCHTVLKPADYALEPPKTVS